MRLFFSSALRSTVVCSTILGIPVLAYGYCESKKLQIRKVEIEFEDLPETFNQYRIVHLTDLHTKKIGRLENNLLDTLSNLQADILILGGDFQFNDYAPADESMEFLRRLAECHSFPDGTLCIRGNHDWMEIHRFLRRQTFMKYLSNEKMILEREGQQIAFCGIRHAGRRLPAFQFDLDRVSRGLKEDTFKILISHAPDVLPVAAKKGFQLVLAGDTHGGQIRLPWIGPITRKTRLPKRFARGLNALDGTFCYTSSGIGSPALPCRIGCPPEIAIHTLRRSGEKVLAR